MSHYSKGERKMGMRNLMAFTYPGNREIVVQLNEQGNPYAMMFEKKEVYCDGKGIYRCLKCLNEVKRLWKTDDVGDFFCERCQEFKGKFRNLGYSTY